MGLALVKSNVEVLERNVNAAGRELVVKVLRMDGNEGLLTTQVCDLLAIDRKMMQKHIMRHRLGRSSLSRQTRVSLREQGVIKNVGSSPNFLPKESVQALIKIVGTPEAWAAYNQLWQAVESPQAYVELKVEAP